MRRRVKWLLLALPLLLAAAFLMSRGENATLASPRAIDFPEQLRPAEYRRAEARRLLPLARWDPNSSPTAARPQDPLLAALGSGTGKMALVIEANAIRFSPIGELLIQCFSGEGDSLRKIREETGIDILQDLDRIALTDDGAIVTGNFQNARFRQLADSEPQSYGDDGRLYSLYPSADSGPNHGGADSAFDAMGIWKNQMMIFAPTPSGTKAVLDRVEGRVPGGPSPISESDTYGEVYGVLSVSALSTLLSEGQSDLGRRLQAVAQRIAIHVDVAHDLALVADVEGSSSQDVQDLGKSIAAALSVALLQARMTSETELAEILEHARVIPGERSFRLELALPMKAIEKLLASCTRGGTAPDEKQHSHRGD